MLLLFQGNACAVVCQICVNVFCLKSQYKLVEVVVMSIADSCLSDVDGNSDDNDNNSFCDISEFAPNPEVLSVGSSIDCSEHANKNIALGTADFQREFQKVSYFHNIMLKIKLSAQSFGSFFLDF